MNAQHGVDVCKVNYAACVKAIVPQAAGAIRGKYGGMSAIIAVICQQLTARPS